MLSDKFFTGTLGSINIDGLKEAFISNVDFETLPSVNQETIAFFESMNTQNENIQFRLADLII